MKISSYIPKLAKAYDAVNNVFNDPTTPYLMINNYGVHHNCWYDIEISLPGAVYEYVMKSKTVNGNTKEERMFGTNISQLGQKMNNYCSQITVPSSSLVTQDLRIGGTAQYSVPYDRKYSPLILQFYLDGGYAEDGGIIAKAFNGWVDFIYNPRTRNLNYYEDYVLDKVKVSLYTTPDGNPLFTKGSKEKIMEVTFHEVFPTDVENIILNGSSSTQPTEYVVNLSYRYATTAIYKEGEVTFGDIVKDGFRLVRNLKQIKKNVVNAIESVKDVF